MAFPATRWTLIRQAAQPTQESRAAMEELCRHYEQPVLAFVQRRVSSRETAEDLTQDFFAMLIRGELLLRANPGRGQFRAFLLNAVRNFLADAYDKASAEKRGGQVEHVSLSLDSAEPPLIHLTADQEFDLCWARTVLQRALDRLELEYSDTRQSIFHALRNCLDGSVPVNGKQLSQCLHLSEGALRVALHRMRQRLGQLIRDEIADTVPSGTDIDDEILNLRKTLEITR